MTRRCGFSRMTMVFLGAIGVLGALVALLVWDSRHPGVPVSKGTEPVASGPPQPLLLYCAAGVQAPIREIAAEYQSAFGVEVQLQFGGSQTLLASAEASHKGDLYLPADDSYIDAARKKGLIEEALPLATMRPVIAVPKGNPRAIHALDDLLKPGVRVAQANPEAAAIGKLTRPALERANAWDALKEHTTVFTGTVNDVANAVAIGSVDAGIVWDTNVIQGAERLDGIDIAPFAGIASKITISVLRTSPRPAAALKFARYVAARDKGLAAFKRHGFIVVAGDAWSEVPELRVLAGAMLRPAIDETISAFEQREGCRVTRVYNGCGILVAQMRAGERPDAYFACDASFMRQVTDLFLDPDTVSSNRLVIVVPRGNPHGIESLKDLGQPGLRLGVGHEKQCALGALTQKTFEQGGLREAIMPNVKVQSPTGDFLVNQLRTGSLDAVVAYVSNTTAAKGELETIDIDIPCAIATEPVAVGRDSQYKYMTGRLLEALESKQSKDRFEAQGFAWTLGRSAGAGLATVTAGREFRNPNPRIPESNPKSE